MQSYTIKISSTSYNTLQQIAARSGESIEALLDQAIEQYRRQKFLEAANQAYTALRNNPEEWAIEMEERQAWDVTLADGLL
ncbi:MAG TPA: toxin-antitoxin system protein [Cyanobacteria bacterium UBA11372]|nr:toxin-antitoxin system protein [Cyanobacteria bacterium UBA11372]